MRESPSRPGIIWIGTDDGNLQVSQNGGDTFTNVYDNIAGAPKRYALISRIEPSHFDPGTAYVAVDNHKTDDWKPYLFKTTDYGKTWTSVAGNLPDKGQINALREDYDNPNLLFVGTEFGLYVTLDGGKEWKKFMNNMPSVRVDDILIHPRDRDLIVATHGRSIWICDDITPLEQMHANSATDLALFDPRPAVEWKNDPSAQRHVGNRDFRGAQPAGRNRHQCLVQVRSRRRQGRVPARHHRGQHHEHRCQGRHESLPVEHARAGASRGGGGTRTRRAGAVADVAAAAPRACPSWPPDAAASAVAAVDSVLARPSARRSSPAPTW